MVAALGARQGPGGREGMGSKGFAVPWAMYVDYDDRFWLNGNYSVYPEPS